MLDAWHNEFPPPRRIRRLALEARAVAIRIGKKGLVVGDTFLERAMALQEAAASVEAGVTTVLKGGASGCCRLADHALRQAGPCATIR